MPSRYGLVLKSKYRIPSIGFRVKLSDHLDGATTNTNYLAPECDTKHSGESDPFSRAQARLDADEVRRAAGAPMGTEEGGASPGDGATGAAQHL